MAQKHLNIRKNKKLEAIAKNKDEICKHLQAGNEVKAKILAENIINEEGQIPCYDEVSLMCD